MCLAIPMKIEKILDARRAIVSRGAAQVEVDVSLLGHPQVGDHVIIHAGYAIETLTLEDAEERIAMFKTIAELSGGGSTA